MGGDIIEEHSGQGFTDRFTNGVYIGLNGGDRKGSGNGYRYGHSGETHCLMLNYTFKAYLPKGKSPFF